MATKPTKKRRSPPKQRAGRAVAYDFSTRTTWTEGHFRVVLREVLVRDLGAAWLASPTGQRFLSELRGPFGRLAFDFKTALHLAERLALHLSHCLRLLHVHPLDSRAGGAT